MDVGMHAILYFEGDFLEPEGSGEPDERGTLFFKTYRDAEGHLHGHLAHYGNQAEVLIVEVKGKYSITQESSLYLKKKQGDEA